MIIVLLETMSMWVHSFDEWHKKAIKYFRVQLRVHYAIKYANSSGSLPADSCPNMHPYMDVLDRVCDVEAGLSSGNRTTGDFPIAL